MPLKVGLPGWPSGTGGGLQTRSTWVRFPPPAPTRMKNMRDFVRQTREAINALIGVEQIWRRRAPDYELSSEDREKVMELLSKVKVSVDLILDSLQGG